MFCLVPNQPFDFVLERHRQLPKEEQPTWILRSLPSRTIAELSQMLQTDSGRALNVIVQAGLVGWRNIRNADKSPAEFRVVAGKRLIYGVEIRGGADGDLVDQVPFDVISELVAAILGANHMDLATAKN